MLASTQCKSEDTQRSGLVGAIQKNTRVANVQVGNIVRLSEPIGYRFPWIIPHPAGTGFMHAVARHFWMIRPQKFVFPPTAKHRGHNHFAPSAVEAKNCS